MGRLVDGAALLFLLAFAITPQFGQSNGSTPTMRDGEFFTIMRTVSDGWNEGNASKAADCFTDDAVYMEPPDRQLYAGRKAIYAFFGGPKQPEPPMQMKWHHLAFNAQEQVGYGEYTFKGNHQYHGIVTVVIKAGKIFRWREYQYQSDTAWDNFVGSSRF
jgi:hypothetical protein